MCLILTGRGRRLPTQSLDLRRFLPSKGQIFPPAVTKCLLMGECWAHNFKGWGLDQLYMSWDNCVVNWGSVNTFWMWILMSLGVKDHTWGKETQFYSSLFANKCVKETGGRGGTILKRSGRMTHTGCCYGSWTLESLVCENVIKTFFSPSPSIISLHSSSLQPFFDLSTHKCVKCIVKEKYTPVGFNLYIYLRCETAWQERCLSCHNNGNSTSGHEIWSRSIFARTVLSESFRLSCTERKSTMRVVSRKAVADKTYSSGWWVQSSFCPCVCVYEQQSISVHVCECFGGRSVRSDAIDPINSQWDGAESQGSRP